MADPLEELLKNNPIARMVRAVEAAAIAIEKLGEALDSVSMFKLPETSAPRSELTESAISAYKDSRSYSGQSDVDYCTECLVKHFSKALGLIEEAESFAVTAGKITPAAAEKVKRAIQEIVAAEDDIYGTVFTDSEVKKLADEIKKGMRLVRKFAWAKKLVYPEMAPIDALKELKQGVKKLLDITYSMGEKYILREQRDKVIRQLESAGVTGDVALKATDIILKAAAGHISYDEASRKLSDLLGYKVELKFDPQQGVILRMKT